MRFAAAISAMLMLLACAGSAHGSGAELQSFGFFDIEAEFGNKDEAAERGTFDQHHLTMIWHTAVNEQFRVLFETAYEHGPTLKAGSGEGKIYLPKAYAEYHRTDALRVRLGKFLPPFGIYNERHDATPTVVPTVLPQSVYDKHLNLSGALADSLGQKVRAYPRFATGAWVLGTAWLGEWELAYQAYLTNGRGSSSHEKDDNRNKGIGGRLVVTPLRGPRLGISWYGDRNGELNDARQDALGIDLEYDSTDLYFETGMILPRLETLAADGTPTGVRREPFGWYVMAGYTLRDRTTPFVYHDRYDPDRDVADDGQYDTAIGINHALAATVFLKAELHFIAFEDQNRQGYRNLVTSLAVAF